MLGRMSGSLVWQDVPIDWLTLDTRYGQGNFHKTNLWTPMNQWMIK